MFLKIAVIASLLGVSAAAQQSAAPSFKPTHVTINSGGKGPDVVLIPGLGSSIKVWEKELPKLLPNYRLHLVQVDGFAGTAAGANAGMKSGMLDAIVSDIDQYLHANGITSAAVIGHSMGGLVGLMLAEKHPGDVSKLVIVDTLPFFSVLMQKETPDEAHDTAIQMRNGVTEASRQDWLKQGLASGQAMATNKDDQQKIAFWAANSDQKIFAEALYEDMITDERPGLPKVAIPVLVLWPYSPDQGKQADVEKMYAKQWSGVPNVKLVRVDNAKHFLMLDQPETFDKEVEAFLK